jgi:hypothetical protein
LRFIGTTPVASIVFYVVAPGGEPIKLLVAARLRTAVRFPWSAADVHPH